MKKKIGFTLVLMLALMMGITMTGCGSDESTEVEETTQVVEETTEETTTESESNSSFEQFKKTMDDYEAFMDSYCDLLEKYNEDPTTFKAEYLEMNQKYVWICYWRNKCWRNSLPDCSGSNRRNLWKFRFATSLNYYGCTACSMCNNCDN